MVRHLSPGTSRLPVSRQRGAALLLVIIALAIGLIVTMSFLRGTSASVAIASNVDRHAAARHVAESGLQTVIASLEGSDDWRQTLASGQWVSEQPFATGTFSVWGEDGEDLDGDGVIENGDGDLSDDASDPVTIVVRGVVGGVTHTARAVLRPGAGGGLRVAMVVRDPQALLPREQGRLELLESWGWQVTLVDDDAAAAALVQAAAAADVVYALDVTAAQSVGNALVAVTRGVVYEDGATGQGLRTAAGTATHSGRSLNVLDNNHGVTVGLPTGAVDLMTADASMDRPTGSLAQGDVLIETSVGEAVVLSVEAGDKGSNNIAVPGRRVSSPFGATAVSDLTTYGERLLRQMLQWAAGLEPGALPQAVVEYEFEPTYDEPVLVGHWALDEDAVVGGGMALGGRLEVGSHSTVDGYDSTLGPYDLTTATATNVETNATGDRDVDLQYHAFLRADVRVGPGSDPAEVIHDPSGSAHVGDVGVLPASMAFRAPTPTGQFDNGIWNPTGKGQDKSQTISSDTRFSSLQMNSHQTMVIDGHVRLDITGDFNMNAHSAILVPAGSSLQLFVGGDVRINSHSAIGDDTTGTGRVLLSLYGGASTLDISAHANVIGQVYVDGDITVNSHSAIYGAVAASGAVRLNSHADLHLDTSLPPMAGFPAGDGAAGNDGYGRGVTVGHAGQSGTAYGFGNGVVVIPHDDRYLLTAGSVAFWFRPDSVAGQQGLLSKDAAGFGDGGHLTLRLDGGELLARLQSTTASYQATAAGIVPGQWHHVVASFGPAGLRLFVDGAQRDVEAYTGGLTTSYGVASGGNTEPIVLGADAAGSAAGAASPLAHYFTGLMDDVRLYDGAFDAGQAMNLVQGDEPGLPASPGPRLVDTSGFGEPVDLYISAMPAVSFLDADALLVSDPVVLASAGAATKLQTALAATDAFAIEMLITPSGLVQTGPARLLAYSSDDSAAQNVMVGQDLATLAARLRTSATPTSGVPTLESAGSLTGNQEHWVLSFGDGAVQYYRDGALVGSSPRPGTLNNWDATFPLVLANDIAAGYPWLGTLHRVAVYDRAMTPAMAGDLAAGRPVGTGGTGGSLQAIWIERP